QAEPGRDALVLDLHGRADLDHAGGERDPDPLPQARPDPQRPVQEVAVAARDRLARVPALDLLVRRGEAHLRQPHEQRLHGLARVHRRRARDLGDHEDRSAQQGRRHQHAVRRDPTRLVGPREAMAKTIRIYLASDFHAAEKAWRKYLNAIKLNVYKADIALVAGDFTGKAIVPIVENG